MTNGTEDTLVPYERRRLGYFGQHRFLDHPVLHFERVGKQIGQTPFEDGRLTSQFVRAMKNRVAKCAKCACLMTWQQLAMVM
jgi:hypothetical protein